ncbi:MAG: hypothetical protein EBS16_03520 [Betaproteobacteria bacterium]|nr:hypothetical protein [Betaproteobacteria bacterium]
MILGQHVSALQTSAQPSALMRQAWHWMRQHPWQCLSAALTWLRWRKQRRSQEPFKTPAGPCAR